MNHVVPKNILAQFYRLLRAESAAFTLVERSQKLMSVAPATAPAATMSANDLADLKHKSVRGGMVTFVSQGANVIIGLASTVVLARLLSPDDYGVIAMVIAITSFAGLFRDLGLSSAAIQKHTLTNAQQSNLFWVNVALGVTLTFGLAAASPLVVWFYHKPEVLWVTVVLSANFLIGSLATQSGALLVRQLRFGRQAAAGIAGGLVGLFVSVVLALHGFRYWSLVWGTLANGVTSTGLLFVLSPFRPGLPSRRTGLKEMLKFGANITAYDFANYFARNLDNILIGRFWGAGALGLYSRAYSLVMFPIVNLRGPINSVAFPAMSRLQNEPIAYRAYYQRITMLLALISMPLSAFLFVSARPIVAVALGPKWEPIVPIFMILTMVSFVQPVITLWGMVVMSRGMTKRYLHLGIFNTFFTIIAFGIGLPWGSVGVAVAYAIVTYALAYPTLVLAFKGTPLQVSDLISNVKMPAIASITAVAACAFAESVAPPTIAPVFKILILSGIFCVIYAGILAAIPRGRHDIRLIRKLFIRGTSNAS